MNTIGRLPCIDRVNVSINHHQRQDPDNHLGQIKLALKDGGELPGILLLADSPVLTILNKSLFAKYHSTRMYLPDSLTVLQDIKSLKNKGWKAPKLIGAC